MYFEQSFRDFPAPKTVFPKLGDTNKVITRLYRETSCFVVFRFSFQKIGFLLGGLHNQD